MIVLHTSDWHLGSPLTARLSPGQIKERKEELLETVRFVLNDGASKGAEAVVMAGDMFDSPRVSARTVTAVLDVIRQHPSLPFYYLPGNHEGTFLQTRSDLPENLHVFGESITVFTFRDVEFLGCTRMTEDMLCHLPPKEKNTRILVWHGAVGSSGEDEAIRLSDLSGQGIDYAALGHYHFFRVYREKEAPLAAYAGTPEGRGYDETGDKGYVLFNTESLEIRFVPTAKRRLYDLPLDISDTSSQREIEDAAEALLSPLCERDLVRIRLVGSFPADVHKDVGAMERRFCGRFYALEVRDESRVRIRMEDCVNDHTLKGEFIRTVMAEPDLSDEEKDDVLRCGLQALLGGDAL